MTKKQTKNQAKKVTQAKTKKRKRVEKKVKKVQVQKSNTKKKECCKMSKKTIADKFSKRRVNYINLNGTHKEIGKALAKILGQNKIYMVPPPPYFKENDFKEAYELYDKYCPGINEELQGFSEESGVSLNDLCYTWMTYLVPRCSGIILSPNKTEDDHSKLALNYEFGLEYEDMTLVKTSATNSYKHIGCSVCIFGRNNGINEHGLAVSMTSCGMPVSNVDQMGAPKIKGLQYWAVIRSLLENCKNTEEAIKSAMKMPIAFNINLFIIDQSGKGALIETVDGNKIVKKLDNNDFLFATNHIAIPEFLKNQPFAMKNSIVRYKNIESFLNKNKKVKDSNLKKFLLKKYPEGNCMPYYGEFFGTIVSMIFDVIEKKISICWFGLEENGWEEYYFDKEFEQEFEEKKIIVENPKDNLFEIVPIN